MKFFFDVETTGLPLDRNASPKDVDNWPRIVQIAWIVLDQHNHIEEERSYIIKPEGYTIPKQASDVHGISTERALAEGIEIKDILEVLKEKMEWLPTLIAHNIEFDSKVLASEMFRYNVIPNLEAPLIRICTMEASTDFCKLPITHSKYPQGKYKWPRLEELYFILFNRKLENAHDALIDVKATVECYLELEKRNIL